MENLGVKIISILVIIFGVLAAIITFLPMLGMKYKISMIPTSFILSIGIMFLVAGLLISFVGIMLWKGKNWAREVIIFFTVLGTVGAITNIIKGDYISGPISLIINGAIGGYLWFNKSVKEEFSKK